jgi:uncharacterized caspase-like protein
MMLRKLFGFVVVATLWIVPADAAPKVALVIGNGAYQSATELPNPPRDAAVMQGLLQNLGFEVLTLVDGGKQDMDLKIREFIDKADSAELAMFFYAGHGMQVNGVNYLIPVDAKLETKSALDFETVNTDSILKNISSDTRVGLVFLDACRNNPLSRSFQKKSRSSSVGQGLATPVGADPNLLIAFATSPGEVALDGDGQNSPFVTALTKHLSQPNKELRAVMTDVKAEVQTLTKREQLPWTNDNLVSNVFLNGSADAPPSAIEASKQDVEQIAKPDDEARQAWDAVKDSTSPAMLQTFAKRYAGTLYGDLANARAAELQEQQQVTKNNAVEGVEPDPPPKKQKPARNAKFSWGVIIASYPKAEAAQARSILKDARNNGLQAELIDTDNYPRLAPGLYAVVIGAGSRDAALAGQNYVKELYPDAYAKQLQ